MNRSCHILVPASFSTSSDAAVEFASLLAHRIGATIDLLYVRDTPTKHDRAAGPSFFADSTAGIAMEQVLSRGHHGRVEIRGRVEFGEVCETITRVAEAGDFDLIVIGRSARRDAAADASEDVARKVAHRVHCPVLVLDATMEPEHARAVPSERGVPVHAGDPTSRHE